MAWLRRTAAACALFFGSCCSAGLARGEAILLDFQTDWCGWCRVMEPVVHELAADGYHVRTIDGDAEPGLVRKYGIQVYPTFVALRDGQEVGRLSGKTSKSQLRALLEKAGAKGHATSPASDDGADKVRGQSPDTTATASRKRDRRPARPPNAHTPGNIAQQSGTEGWESAGVPSAEIAPLPRTQNDDLIAVSVRLRIQDNNGQSTGSGTIIDARDGEALILTCGHMFRQFHESGRILVDLFGPAAPQQIPGTLVSYDLNSDVALVRVAANHRFVAAKVAPSGYTCRAGDAVVSVGCDNGDDATPRVTKIVSIDRYQHAPNLQVAFEPVQGRSGGGLFNRQGQLIGVCNAADAQDKQGLFAALGAIYAELDRAKLSFVYKPDASPLAAVRSETHLTDVTPVSAPRAAAAAQLSAEERALLDELRATHGAEVICLVRALDDPQARSRVFQINRASTAFWRELAAVSSSAPDRKLTSLEDRANARASGSKRTVADVPLAAQARSAALNLERSTRVWPPPKRDR